jgi:glycosyltransferase involved in cell wall biosynthesis
MIPTWNPNPAYLKEALDSVLMQDMGEDQMQIAVVDDRSTKIDVQSLLDEWNLRNRVEWYQNEKNLGIGGAWNSSIEKSRGELIHILHQDDVLLDGFYIKAEECFQRNSDVGMYYNRIIFITENGTWKTFSKLELTEPGVLGGFVFSLIHSDIQCPGVVVKKEAYNTVGNFNEKLMYALDHEMWARISTKFKIWFDPQPKACFRINPYSASYSFETKLEQLKDVLKSDNLIASMLDESSKKLWLKNLGIRRQSAILSTSGLPLSHKLKTFLYQPSLRAFLSLVRGL